MHKGIRSFDLIMLRNGLWINFVDRTGNDPRFKRHNYHHLRKSKIQTNPNRHIQCKYYCISKNISITNHLNKVYIHNYLCFFTENFYPFDQSTILNAYHSY